MVNLNVCFFVMILAFVFCGCEKTEVSLAENLNDSFLGIEPRSPDPNCEICDDIPEAHCCCVIENTEESETSLDLHVCGVIGSHYGMMGESCSMYVPFGPPCTQVNNQGIHAVVPYLGKLYFCIAQNAPFSIYNANGSGEGKIRVGCNSANMPQGSIGHNLSYDDGGFTRYFTTSTCTVQTPCDY